MSSGAVLQVDFDRLLVLLFQGYAFSLPFELVLEVLFGIETVLKPFRVISILIVLVYLGKCLHQGCFLFASEKKDFWLYAVFAYGLFISMIRMITGIFNLKIFINDTILFSLCLMVYFIFKNTALSSRQLVRIFQFLMAGLLLNSLAILSFIGIQSGGIREAGFMDNPNYVAFALTGAIVYILLKSSALVRLHHQILALTLVGFFIFIFGIQGSRGSFILLAIAGFFIFLFSDLKKKVALIGFIVLLGVGAVSQLQETDNVVSGLNLLRRISNKGAAADVQEDIRFPVWRGLFQVLEEKGYAGMGIGQFKAQFARHFADSPRWRIQEMVNYGYYLSPHNDYLSVLADYGLPSLVFFMVFFFINILHQWNQLSQVTQENPYFYLYQFQFIFLICLAVFGMGAENFNQPLYWFFLMVTTKSALPSTEN